MATQTSSMLGVDLSGVGAATQLFALGTSCEGSSDSEWSYVEATATFITGEIVLINQSGTAKTLISSLLTQLGGIDGSYDLGFCQNIISQGNFGWVAKRGRNLYVLVTGTLTAGSDQGLGIGENSGRLEVATVGGVGSTIYGVVMTETTAGAAATGQWASKCVLTWPRFTGVHT